MKTLGAARKTALSTLAFSLYLHAASSYAAALDVSQQPLMLVDSVAPNLIFTLDDSGSMRWAFVPDSMGANDNSVRNNRRTKSAAFNPMYYNPEVDYLLPVKLNSNGSEASPGFSTSFTNAYHNGFRTDLGARDLANNYRVSWNDDINVSQNYNYNSSTNYTAPTGRIYNLAQNPTTDFSASCSRNTNGACSPQTTAGGAITFNISRTSTGCTATATFDGVTLNNVSCSRNNNNMTASVTQTAVPAYYYTRNNTTSCQTTPNNDDCYTLVRVSETSGINGRDERENFAIWYSFYRNRALATLSAANLAFNELPASVRFTWQSLGNCTSLNSNNCNNNRFRTFGGQHKYNFFEWMQDLQFNQGTPLRAALDRAGKFLQTDVAWAATPNPIGGTTITNPVLSCRPSYHILMTDGMWNGDDGSPTGTFRHDASSFTLPDGENYNGTRAPFADSTNNTLADLAMHYWATDLRSTIPNELKKYGPYVADSGNWTSSEYWDPRNNPATWQHMVNFNVGLALTSALNQPGLEWDGSTFAGEGYQSLKNGQASWPPASASNDNNVYDLWHAAINSRGEFFSADSPEEIVGAFNDIINRIAERTSTAAKPGVSTDLSDLEADNFSVTNRLFESSYDSSDWSGDLTRTDVIRHANGAVTQTPLWSARQQLPSPNERTIWMAGGSGTNSLQSFDYNNLGSDLQAIFNTNPDALGNTVDSRGNGRVSYLRGNRSGEGDTAGTFRRRSSPLGDIINSSPVLVGTPSYLPYLADRIDGSPGDYLAFQNANRPPRSDTTGGRPELVYVGANDGMLHAFDADTGAEVFAFIPSMVLPNMPRLTGQSYQGGAHRYFVDGTPVVRDVYFDGGWRTVLVGTLRAGGKGLFALDITNPGNVQLLWEISNETEGYENLGYTFAEPEIVRLHSGQWGILLGNGYDSVDDKASMFVIDIANGNLLTELVVDQGTNGANGLSSVRGADNNGDGVVDYAYAGDLQGNLWRFDLINTTTTNQEIPDPFARSVQGNVQASSFDVSYGGQPLYRARASNGDVQPITAIPSLVRHPTRRGYIVIVGTGKYFETSDAAPDTSKAQAVYGIWDRLTRAQSTSNTSRPSLSRSNLHGQSISAEQAHNFDGNSLEVRVISQTLPQWYMANTTPAQEELNNRVQNWGWFIDLQVQGQALEGEMMVNRMEVRGDTILFSSLIPNEDPCADGTSGWVYALNAQTGARTFHPALDFNADGRFDSNDTIDGMVVSGFKQNSPGGIALSGDGMIFGGSGNGVGFSPSPELEGRQSWQVIPLEDN